MKPRNEELEKAKRNAALEAVKHVKDGFVIGLGSGSTVTYAAEEIGRRIRSEGLNVKAVPTSYQALMLALKNGIPITTLDENPTLDLTIDGADQIDENLNLIKGMGGALTREKIVASASKTLIIIADWRKKAKRLGENDQPVPIEVLPFASSPVIRKISMLGGKPTIREGAGKVGPIITDNGNFIIDANFGPIEKPAELEKKLKTIPGIVETGLFIEMADIVYLGKHDSVERLKRKGA
ncbi:MAG: ribose 5-phosphate isomerase A [Candidatus Bathyarchaeia archaeon]